MPESASAPSSIGPGADRRREKRHAGRREVALRRERIFEQLVAGGSYLAIAREENCSVQWIRRIVAEALHAREAGPSAEFKMLQIARLNLALNVSHDAMMNGDLAAVDPYLKTIKELDRYHGLKNMAAQSADATAAAASVAAARRKLPATNTALERDAAQGASKPLRN